MAYRCATSLLIITILLLSLAAPTSAFGAGYVSPGSHLKSARFRHGDIALAVPLLATANRRLVKQIYFGNWLRDFSQLLDKGSIALVPRPIIRALVAVFAFLQFGYSTREFEVTDQRLGVYRPEEHVDNPKGYDGAPSLAKPVDRLMAAPEDAAGKDNVGYRVSEGLRPAVHPTELAIDTETGMKNYIGNASKIDKVNPTSIDYVEKQLIAAIACGRQGDEEAYIHLGAALHTLEDFAAHSNYVELAMQMIGQKVQNQGNLDVASALKNVFAFVGSAARMQTANGPSPPIVTGTFGALDLYQTLLGEIDDKLNAVSLPSLETRMPPSDEGGPLQTAAKQLIGLLNSLTPHFEKDILKVQKAASEGSKEPATWGHLDEHPEKLWEALEPVFKLRDDVVKWVYDHLAIKAVQDALASISIAIDKLVFLVLGIVLRPILPELLRVLKEQEQQLLREDQASRVAKGEQTVFEADSTSTDPTHSQLAKDHYDHPLNEVAGRVAVRISSYTVTNIVQLWQPGNDADPRSSIQSILEVFHHPMNCGSSPVQVLMLDEVRSFIEASLKANPQAFEETLRSLSLPAVASRMDLHVGGHTHVDAPLPKSGASSDQLLAMRLSYNIEHQVRQGAVNEVSVADLPTIKDLLFASPSAGSPNPLDAGLAKMPGINFLGAFNGIGVSEIAAYPGMGETMKDAIIALILLDEERGGHEEDIAATGSGGFGERLKDEESKARLRELRPLLSFKANPQLVGRKEDLDESKGASAKEKLSAGIEKMKLKASGAF